MRVLLLSVFVLVACEACGPKPKTVQAGVEAGDGCVSGFTCKHDSVGLTECVCNDK